MASSAEARFPVVVAVEDCTTVELPLNPAEVPAVNKPALVTPAAAVVVDVAVASASVEVAAVVTVLVPVPVTAALVPEVKVVS